MDPSGKSALKHRPGATDYSSRHPSMAVLGGLLLRQPRTVQGLGKPYLIRRYLSGVDYGAKAGESRPHCQLILVRRKFGARRLSRYWAGNEQRYRNRRLASWHTSVKRLNQSKPWHRLTNQSYQLVDRGCYLPVTLAAHGREGKQGSIQPLSGASARDPFTLSHISQADAAAATATAATAGTLLHWRAGGVAENQPRPVP